MKFSDYLKQSRLLFSNLSVFTNRVSINESYPCIDTANLLTEAERLDISIVAANKYLTNDKKFKEFFETPVKIEAKTDGVKVTAMKVADNGDIDDWIIAYKGQIMYAEEFNYLPDTEIKKSSIGFAQFKLLLKHFSKLGKTDIPVGTELQLEYLMRKPTLSSNYEHPHGIVLIGYSKSTYTVDFGLLKTQNSGMNTQENEKYAKELKINTPLKIFDGILGNRHSFEEGILSPELKRRYMALRDTINFDDYRILYDQISALLLSVPSAFGGVEEGVVLKFNNGLILKIQQSYQVDQNARNEIKNRWRDEPELENEYWERVKGAAMEIYYSLKKSTLQNMFKQMCTKLKTYEVTFTHGKKNEVQIKDDIQGNVKLLIIKNLKGNSGCLVLGKFRVLTKAHYTLIKNALKEYDRVAVCIVSSKETKDTLELREKMMRKAFDGKVEIMKSSSGNLIRIITTAPFNINAVYAGTDRVESYQKQIGGILGMSVRELPRDESGISATKIIANINDEKYFKANTPRTIHSLYSEIKDTYS